MACGRGCRKDSCLQAQGRCEGRHDAWGLGTMNDLLLNTSLSVVQSGMQLAWDSTSMGLLKECPRKYQLSILEGWTPKRTSVHLLFGLWYHGALERYDHAKSD